MIEISLKYDYMHTNRIFNALNYINNHINSFIIAYYQLIEIIIFNALNFILSMTMMSNDCDDYDI